MRTMEVSPRATCVTGLSFEAHGQGDLRSLERKTGCAFAHKPLRERRMTPLDLPVGLAPHLWSNTNRL
jgi:hypothetical protein